jgi:hypothetical protein
VEPRRKNPQKKMKKSDPENLEKPQYFRLSSPKMPKPIRMQQHPLGILVSSNLLLFK